MVTGSKGVDSDKGVKEWIKATYNKGGEVIIFNRFSNSSQFQVLSACLVSLLQAL